MQAYRYQQAGVDIDKNERFVAAIKRLLGRHPSVRPAGNIGGFAGLYPYGNDRYLCAASDGVGTKVLLAHQYRRYEQIGIDLVAMSVNDLLCCGARPLFFLDYLAYSNLGLEAMEAIIAGIIAGCEQAGCVLLGGETAEMPGMYQAGVFDLAGFALGEVSKTTMIRGEQVKAGDCLVGLAASGFHANGYSLLRSLHKEVGEPEEWVEGLLTATKIYVRPLLEILSNFPGTIKGMAHITGSGFHNIARINSQVDYVFEYLPSFTELPEIFSLVLGTSPIPREELYSTFNMGVGMVLVVEKTKVDALIVALAERGVPSWQLGHLVKGEGNLVGLQLKNSGN